MTKNKKECFDNLLFSNKEIKDYLASGLMLSILGERHRDWIKRLEDETKAEIKGLKSQDMRAILAETLRNRKVGVLKIVEAYKRDKIKNINKRNKIKKINKRNKRCKVNKRNMRDKRNKITTNSK